MNIDFIKIWFPVFLLALFVLPILYAFTKGAPYVPSKNDDLSNLKKILPDDKTLKVIDLGSGDGKVLRYLHKMGYRDLHGYELTLPPYLMSKLFNLIFWKRGIKISMKNIWKAKIDQFDVVFLFLLPKAIKTFYESRWDDLKEGTLVISNYFAFKDQEPLKKEGSLYLYKK